MQILQSGYGDLFETRDDVSHRRVFVMNHAQRLVGAVVCVAFVVMDILSMSTWAAEPIAQFASVDGRVIDADGVPIGGVDVGLLMSEELRNARRRGTGSILASRTDKEGKFRLRVPQSLNSVVVVARAPLGLITRSGSIALGQRGVVDLVIRGRHHRVDGVVLDEKDIPVRTAEVMPVVVEPSTTLESLGPLAVDQRGRFVIEGSAEGAYAIRAHAHGFAPSTIVIEPGGVSKVVEVRLFAPTSVTGKVVDSSSQPVANALVVAIPGLGESIETRSDASGRFSLSPFAAGTRLSLKASAKGYSTRITDDVIAPFDGLIVQLLRNGSVVGQVQDMETGNAIRRFTIKFHQKGPLGSAEFPGSREFIGSNGRFTWPDVFAGKWDVSVSAEGYADAFVPGVIVPQGKESEALMIRLAREVSMSGSIIDRSTREGVANAQISLHELGIRHGQAPRVRNSTVVSAHDGSFELKGLIDLPVTLMVRAPGYPAQTQRVQTVANHIEIALSRGGIISGVLTSSTSEPIAGTVDIANHPSAFGLTKRVGADGKFEFRDLAPGRYELTGQSSLGVSERRVVTVEESAGVSDIVLRLKIGRTVSGVVRDLLPGEVAGTEVTARGSDGFVATTAVSANGAYELQGVPSGEIQLNAATRLDRELTKTLDVKIQGNVTVDFDFGGSLRISGKVTRAGAPVGFVQIQAIPIDRAAAHVSGETTSTGQYYLEGLSIGAYRLLIRGGGEEIVNLAANKIIDIALPDLSVAGLVTDAQTGQPIPSVVVEAIMRAAESGKRLRTSATTDHRGSFQLAGLEAGTYRVNAHTAGYDISEQTIEVVGSSQNASFTLTRHPGVQFHVLDADSGMPIREVVIIEVLSGQNGRRFPMLLDESGAGTLPPSIAGRHFTAWSPGYEVEDIPVWHKASSKILLNRSVQHDE